jgi:hypothetical protein
MNGVEILSSETIYNTILPEWCSAVGFVCLLVFGVCISASIDSERLLPLIICCICFLGSGACMILGSIENKNDIGYIEYKVTIDDSVPMNEFLDKYEILDQEGKIYTVKERE